MNNYKLCLCDMDGTLLNSQGVISKENEIALKKLQKAGVEIVIASGRVDLMVKNFIRQLELKGHVISCNGGLIRNISTGEILYSKAMGKNRVGEITKYCIDEGISFLIYTNDMVYSTKDNPIAIRYEKLNKSLSEDLRIPIQYVNNLLSDVIDNKEVLKILLVCNGHEAVESYEKHFSKFEDLTVVSSASGLLDIMASNINKGNALKLLSEKLGVELSEVIAFGDNYNDLEMLKYAGMSIAIKNAVEDVKLVARHVTKSNDESGIAYAIDNFILGDGSLFFYISSR